MKKFLKITAVLLVIALVVWAVYTEKLTRKSLENTGEKIKQSTINIAQNIGETYTQFRDSLREKIREKREQIQKKRPSLD
jgi:uncharacterized protein YoxC